jgi:hypothetical protein
MAALSRLAVQYAVLFSCLGRPTPAPIAGGPARLLPLAARAVGPECASCGGGGACAGGGGAGGGTRRPGRGWRGSHDPHRRYRAQHTSRLLRAGAGDAPYTPPLKRVISACSTLNLQQQLLAMLLTSTHQCPTATRSQSVERMRSKPQQGRARLYRQGSPGHRLIDLPARLPCAALCGQKLIG